MTPRDPVNKLFATLVTKSIPTGLTDIQEFRWIKFHFVVALEDNTMSGHQEKLKFHSFLSYLRMHKHAIK